MADIEKVSHKHEMILQFMIANPTMLLRDVAQRFSVTQAWLSTVIHSDAFKDKLSERQDEIFGVISADLKEQMRAIANVGLEKIARFVETSEDKPYVTDTTFGVLDRLGFSAKAVMQPTSAQQNNVYFVSKDDLNAARGSISNGGSTEIKQLPAESA